jgi:hypothetical protein
MPSGRYVLTFQSILLPPSYAPEEGGSRYLQNVSKHQPDHRMSHTRRQYPSIWVETTMGNVFIKVWTVQGISYTRMVVGQLQKLAVMFCFQYNHCLLFRPHLPYLPVFFAQCAQKKHI